MKSIIICAMSAGIGAVMSNSNITPFDWQFYAILTLVFFACVASGLRS